MPGTSFINGTTGVIAEDDECILDVMVPTSGDQGEPTPHPRFLGCKRRHFFVHSLIFQSISAHISQFNSGIKFTSYTKARGSLLHRVLRHGFQYSIGKHREERFKAFTSPQTDNVTLQSVTLIKAPDSLRHPFLTNFTSSNSTSLHVDLQIKPSPMEECVDMSEKNLSEHDIESLLQLVGGHDAVKDTCNGNGNLTVMNDTYKSQSISNDRKIPKIVHMTSKTRCMTDRFVENINLWRFDDHSLFMHDDEAVNRLLEQVFVEFPLLQDVRHCIHSGAGLADLW